MAIRYLSSHQPWIYPEKDMAMLAGQARQGWKVTRYNVMLDIYRFERTEPEELIFDSTLVPNPPEDYSEFIEATGWTPVIITDGFQVFSAKPGTEPVFSDDSRSYWLNKRARKFGAIFLFFLVPLLITINSAPNLEITWGIPFWFPFFLGTMIFGFLWFAARFGADKLTLQEEGAWPE